MAELRDLLAGYEVWADEYGAGELDEALIADLVRLRDQTYGGGDPAEWSAEQVTGVVFDVVPYVYVLDEGFLRSLKTSLPLYFGYLQDAGHPVGEVLRDAKAIRDLPPSTFEQMAKPGLWCLTRRMSTLAARAGLSAREYAEQLGQLSMTEREAIAGPHNFAPGLVVPADPYAGEPIPRPRRPLPSRLAEAVRAAPAIQDLITVVQQALETQTAPEGQAALWRIAATAELVYPAELGIYAGPALETLTTTAPDPIAQVEVWKRGFQVAMNQLAFGNGADQEDVRQQIWLSLFEAYKSGQTSLQAITTRLGETASGSGSASQQEAVVTAYRRLERLGAVTIDGDTVTLTDLGVIGLFHLTGWTAPWTLDAGEWSPALTPADLHEVIAAAADATLAGGVKTMHDWVSAAATTDPEAFVTQLSRAIPGLSSLGRHLAFSCLLQLDAAGAPALPQLLDTDLAAGALMLYKNLGLEAPREPTTAEMEQFFGDLIELMRGVRRAIDDAIAKGEQMTSQPALAIVLTRFPVKDEIKAILGKSGPWTTAEMERLKGYQEEQIAWCEEVLASFKA